VNDLSFLLALKLGKAKRFRGGDSRGESGPGKALKALFSSWKETQMNQLANLFF
jgi:hypothetical protein